MYLAKIQRHLKKTLLTGVLSAIPLAVTIALVVYVEKMSREPVKAILGLDIPFIGFVVAFALIYLIGLIVSSLVGRIFLKWVDRVLLKVPILRDLYRAWKQISLTPGTSAGIYSKVVLIPDSEHALLGFTSGDALEGDPSRCCVYIPESPNPMSGQLRIVERNRLTELNLSVDDAFKMLLSGGNYLPSTLSQDPDPVA
ncbi:MAG TPA: DUF502 domain-containing protein, partial [Nannocystis exedens]|nr:DUF502 domain-containing protein [Nannocystis exedens]